MTPKQIVNSLAVINNCIDLNELQEMIEYNGDFTAIFYNQCFDLIKTHGHNVTY